VSFSVTATATLLIIDAWFDMTTSASRTQFLEAFVLAILVEIPAAVFSLYVARQVNRSVLELARQAGTTPEDTAAGRSVRRRRRSPSEAAD
jgi:hypothetical protein